MKELYLRSNEKKNSGKERNKIEARLADRKQEMNSLKIAKILKWNLTTWGKYRSSVEKWISGKLMSLTF